MNIPTETQPVMLKFQKKYANHNNCRMTYCNRLTHITVSAVMY